MKKSALTVIFLTFAISMTALASEPLAVCNTIQVVDSFSSTAKNASTCKSLVSDGAFDPTASDVCLTIAKMDGFSSTQANALKCLQVIKNITFDKTSAKCLDIAKSGSFSSDQSSAIACLEKASKVVVRETKNNPPTKTEIPVSKDKEQSRVSAGTPVVGVCPKNKDCWSEVINELKTKYHCQVVSDIIGEELTPSGETIFGINSFNCQLMDISSKAGLCPSGTQARAVGNVLKICISAPQNSVQSTAAEKAVN